MPAPSTEKPAGKTLPLKKQVELLASRLNRIEAGIDDRIRRARDDERRRSFG
jgi:hypothetical protein